ncbi:helix-turn-helix transcriptional regulator [Chitinophaga vietnamensis]|uniref:helix-turn-helix transcriptional regulator n=1 Tax=Chitinophaga vietnamensis TaxID=2593957 RepID=UPI00191C3FD6|nr:response regulator transcription factor [Chitinophaga vietnamensis]
MRSQLKTLYPADVAVHLPFIPLVLTADTDFYRTLKTRAGLDSISMLLPLLQDFSKYKGLLGEPLLLFIDVDAYDPLSLVHFMQQSENMTPTVVIALSACDDLQKALCYLKSGMSGYFLKEEMDGSLIEEMVRSYPGKVFPLSPQITRLMVEELVSFRECQYNNLLSKREQEILQLISGGLSYKMIASRLGISIETVRHHIKKIYRKMEVNSKGEILAKLTRPAGHPPFM